MNTSLYRKCPKHIGTYFMIFQRYPKCLDEATKERALQAFNYLIDLDKFSLNNVSGDFPSETTGYFFARIKSDEEDAGDFYDGEELIRLAKSEGWNG